MKNFLVSLLVAAIATGISYFVAFHFGWIDSINWLEALAVATGFSSTYLCVVQSRWNYLMGMISTIAFCIFFIQLKLFSSAALNFYLPFALLYGWMRWGPDNNTRRVTWLGWNKLWFSYGAWAVVIWAMCFGVAAYFGAALPITDSAIVGLSVLAQLLLDNKRNETWIFWALVNILAICTYGYGGAMITALQYVMFLGNTAYGFYSWKKSMEENIVYPQVTHG